MLRSSIDFQGVTLCGAGMVGGKLPGCGWREDLHTSFGTDVGQLGVRSDLLGPLGQILDGGRVEVERWLVEESLERRRQVGGPLADLQGVEVVMVSEG